MQIKINEALNKINNEQNRNDELIRYIIKNTMIKYHEENKEKLNGIIFIYIVIISTSICSINITYKIISI